MRKKGIISLKDLTQRSLFSYNQAKGSYVKKTQNTQNSK